MEVEVVLGMGGDAIPKACSTSSASEIVSAEKTLIQENGVKVSSDNFEEKMLLVDDKSKEEDFVMNGVSSLLKLKQDITDMDNDLQVDVDEEEEDGEEEEEEEHGYCVGDFVWGKIKNHPWWPGQIYDPSDASDLALKIKQKGKLLVAYFGDRTFAWCDPSQLKPFAESFNDCSKVSNSKRFVSAVKEAVEEMGRHIERLIVCDCAVEKAKLDGLEAKNAGIREGVYVRDVRRENISSLVVGKPEGIIRDVRRYAQTVRFSGLLELEILKRKVSAFYRSKGEYGLIKYPEPESVPGLEDKNNDDDDDDDEENVIARIEWRSGGSTRSTKEEEEEQALDPEESLQRLLESCSGFPDNRLQHRKKKKSISEILKNESAAKVISETEPAEGNVKSSRKKVRRSDEGNGELENVTTTTTPRRRRRMGKVSTVEDGHKKVEENSKGETLSRKKKRMDEDDNDESHDREESAHVNEVSEMDIDSTPLSLLRTMVKFHASTGNGETSTQTLKRERKKSKYFSPEYLTDFSWKGKRKSKTESESSKARMQMVVASNSLVVVEEDEWETPCELLLLENGTGHQEPSKELSNAVEFLRLGATPKEMGELIRVAALGIQYPKDRSSRDMVREYMTIYRSFTYHEGANRKCLGSYDSSEKDAEELNEMGKNESKGKEGRAKKSKEKKKTEELERETRKKDRKPTKSASKKQEDKEEETPKESKKKERKPKKPRYEEEETQNETEKTDKTKKREGKSKKQRVDKKETETEKEFSGAELIVGFNPGTSLPKKEDLIQIYEKFGPLEQERTCVFNFNFCARVAFLNVADGEKAFEYSQQESPFASASVDKFRLKYPNERREEKKAKAEAEEKAMEMECVKKKLDEMRSLVAECEGGMSQKAKVKLEEEIVTLLEKVKKM